MYVSSLSPFEAVDAWGLGAISGEQRFTIDFVDIGGCAVVAPPTGTLTIGSIIDPDTGVNLLNPCR